MNPNAYWDQHWDQYWAKFELDHCRICITGVPTKCFGCMYFANNISCLLTERIVQDPHHPICTTYDFTKRLLEVI